MNATSISAQAPATRSRLGLDAVARLARQSRETASAARHLPAALLRTGTTLLPLTGASDHCHPATGHAPVVLVHGYAASLDCWSTLAGDLSHHGFDDIHAFAYNGVVSGPFEVARSLAETVASLVQRAGADGVHLVGHSLGGIIVRLAVEYGGLWDRTATVVTITTPHRGTPLAWAAPGPSGRWMRPGMTVLSGPSHSRTEAGPRYVNFYGSHDAVVPPSSARLDDARVTNIRIERSGHLGATRADEVRGRLPVELFAAEAARRLPEPLLARRVTRPAHSLSTTAGRRAA
jgi:pimeloyl-ACP methyl ester carboxylesterase